MQTVEDYISSQEPGIQPLLSELRKVILDTDNRISEALKWNQPCYCHHGLLCYVSIKKHHIELGFCKGYLLSNVHGLLQESSQPVIRSVEIHSFEDLDRDAIKKLVAESMQINERKKVAC